MTVPENNIILMSFAYIQTLLDLVGVFYYVHIGCLAGMTMYDDIYI